MIQTNESLLQKNLLKVFQNKLLLVFIEVFILLLIGAFAITLHSKLRIPMHIPGKQGLMFMFIIMNARMLSNFKFATTISVFGASALLFFNVLGIHDPFIPIIYLLVGFTTDIFFIFLNKINKTSWYIIAIAGALGYAIIPLSRIIISLSTGIMYPSLMISFVIPVFSHFAFAYAGSAFAILLVSKNINKNQ